MPDIKVSNRPAIWIQDADNKLNFIKQYRILYRDEEIGIIIDFDKGLIEVLEGLNAEVEVEEIK